MKCPAQQAGQKNHLGNRKAPDGFTIPQRRTHTESPSHKTVAGKTLQANTQVAMAWAKRGFAVLPLKERSKAPANNNGLTGATRNPEEIRGMFEGHPKRNVGILPPPNVLVIDIDDPSQHSKLVLEYPEMASAPTHRTPSGGYHIFLRVPNGWTCPVRNNVFPGVDICGLGKRYVIAPPSGVIDNEEVKRYRVIRPISRIDTLPTASPALREAIKPPPPPRRAQQPPPRTGHHDGYVFAALSGEAYTVAHTMEGGRNNQLNTSAVKLGSLAGAGLLDPEEARKVLLFAAERCGLPDWEAKKTIESGLRYGMANPRGLPHE